jgi:hypothetical protein
MRFVRNTGSCGLNNLCRWFISLFSYYWRCEKRDALQCKGRAVTTFIEGQYHLQKVTDHNHAAEASRVNVIRTVNTLKERGKETNEPPAEIIQTTTASISHEAHPYLPSCDALRQTINRIRSSDLPVEPESLNELIVPEDLTKTLSGSDFLVKDIVLDQDRILLFTTIANVQYLEQSLSGLWMEHLKQFQIYLDSYIQFMDVLVEMKIHK